jgi:hypothetical protein
VVAANGTLEPSRAKRNEWWARRRTEKLAGVCMIVSGSVHGLITQEHFTEWWGYGVFFLVAAICLIGFGLALITDAIDPRYTPGDVQRLRRIMYLVGIAGNIGLLTLYTLTRTAGIPFGPGSGNVESVAGPDVVANLAEASAAVALIVLIWNARTRPRAVKPPRGGRSSAGRP